MAITKQLEFSNLDIQTKNWTISIAFQTVFYEDGVEVFRSKPLRRGFVPGDIEKVKQFTGLGDQNKHIQYINSLWTPQVIAAYQASLPQE